MNTKQLLSKIKEMDGVKPSASWKQERRDILLSQIKAQMPQQQKRGAFIMARRIFRGVALLRSTKLMFKNSGVFALIVGLTLGTSVAGVKAAEKSVPGDVLYNVKLAGEQVQLQLSGSADKQTELYVKFAGIRLDEVSIIQDSSDKQYEKVENISTAIENFNKELDNIKNSLEDVDQEGVEPKIVVAIAQHVDEKIEEYQEYLDLEVVEAIDSVDDDSKDTFKDALEKTKEVSDDAVSLLVDQNGKEGLEDSVKEDIKNTVIEKIIQAAEDAKEAESDLAELTELDVETEVVENTEPENSEGSDNSEDLNGQDEPITITEESGQLLEDVKDNSEKAESLLEEANSLVESGDLVQAVEKFQESTALVEVIKDVVEDVNDDIAIQELQKEALSEEQQVEPNDSLEDSKEDDAVLSSDQESGDSSNNKEGEDATDSQDPTLEPETSNEEPQGDIVKEESIKTETN